MRREARIAIAGVTAALVGVLAALVIYAMAIHKGFARVLASGEGGMVFAMMALAGGLLGRTSFGIVLRALERRARRRATPAERHRR